MNKQKIEKRIRQLEEEHLVGTGESVYECDRYDCCDLREINKLKAKLKCLK